ncbi:hypothetical protein C2E23DRAFT_858591 [Lenzites betulinus]|nr:hypothetical protein C2E23DRAFT_858591 [Lenzites betulinus]
MHTQEEVLEIEALIPKYREASEQGLLVTKYIDRLQGMATSLTKHAFVIVGIKDRISTFGDFKIHRNQLIAGISSHGKPAWFGDVVVAKMEVTDDAGISKAYVDIKPSDYCLLYNYFIHEQ